jgi:hypothetical protein
MAWSSPAGRQMLCSDAQLPKIGRCSVPVPPFQVSGVHLGPAIHLFGPVSSARIKVVLEIPGFLVEAGEILAFI